MRNGLTYVIMLPFHHRPRQPVSVLCRTGLFYSAQQPMIHSATAPCPPRGRERWTPPACLAAGIPSLPQRQWWPPGGASGTEGHPRSWPRSGDTCRCDASGLDRQIPGWLEHLKIRNEVEYSNNINTYFMYFAVTVLLYIMSDILSCIPLKQLCSTCHNAICYMYISLFLTSRHVRIQIQCN